MVPNCSYKIHVCILCYESSLISVYPFQGNSGPVGPLGRPGLIIAVSYDELNYRSAKMVDPTDYPMNPDAPLNYAAGGLLLVIMRY